MTGKRARLDLEIAKRMADAALAAAREGGNRVSVAIVDTRGHDVLVVRDDGAAWFTAGVARAKAATSALIGIPTTAYSGLAQAHPALADLIDGQAAQSLTTLPGGLPIVVAGEIAGGIGVSGAQPDEDVDYARAGMETV